MYASPDLPCSNVFCKKKQTEHYHCLECGTAFNQVELHNCHKIIAAFEMFLFRSGIFYVMLLIRFRGIQIQLITVCSLEQRSRPEAAHV